MFSGANLFKRVYATHEAENRQKSSTSEEVDVYGELSTNEREKNRKIKKCWEKVAPKLRSLIFAEKNTVNVLPDDYYANPDYHRDSNWLVQRYLRISIVSRKIVEGNYFNAFVTFAICVAGILVGVQTYPGLADNPIVDDLDHSVLAIFTLEIVMKVCMEGLKPWM